MLVNCAPNRRLPVAAVVLYGVLPLGAGSSLVLSQDGLSVYDSANNITWLADANSPVTNRFGLPLCTSGVQPCVNPNGSMNYQSAVAWIAA